MNTWVKRSFMLALVLLAAVNLANFDRVNAASSAPPGIKDGAYMWYKFVDFRHANKTDYMYVEFVEVHEHTAEMVIRTGLLNSNESEWSQHPPLYGNLDLGSGDLTLVGAKDGVGLSFWTSPQNAHRSATSGFPPDGRDYSRVEYLVFESEKNGDRWWYDRVTGVLIETSFLSGDLPTRIVILYETNIPVARGAANQWAVPLETPAGAMTYAAVLIGSVAVVTVAVIGLVRFRRKAGTPQGVLVKRCPSCGYNNRDDAVFCSSCGSSLAAPAAPVMDLQNRLDLLTKEKSSFGLNAKSNELAELENRHAALYDGVNKLIQGKLELEGKISALEASITTFGQNQDQMKSQIVSIEKQIADVQSRIEASNRTLAGHEVTIKQLQDQRKPEPPVLAVTPPRELDRTTASPPETRRVCRTCGHVNPEWIRNYCVRCAARLKTD